MTEPNTPVDSPAGKRRRLRHEGGPRRVAGLFALSLGFYLALGGFSGAYDAVTGVLSAAVTTLLLGRVAFRNGLGTRTLGRLWRAVGFLPRLLWEVVKANVALAAVVLHPSLPVQPQVLTVDVETTDDLERAFLANCVTLTPGTVVLDVRGSEFHVHALTTEAAADLASGRLIDRIREIFAEPDENDR